MPDLSNLVLIAAALILIYVGYLIGRLANQIRWLGKVPGVKKDAIKKARATISGQMSEQIAPYLPDFPYNPTEVRFIGKPLDFVVFKGIDSLNPTEIIFVEVKSGESTLSTVQRKLRDVIKKRKVRWEEYRVHS